VQISDVGGTSLGRAAKGALALSRLNISLNNTTDATLHALADALRFNMGVCVNASVCVWVWVWVWVHL